MAAIGFVSGCSSARPGERQVSPAATPPPAAPTHHFYDPASLPIQRLELAWPTLEAFFGDALPPHVTVDYEPTGQSHSDTYGQAKLRSLFVDIGKTRSLGSSVSTVLGRSLDETEQLWEAYLREAALVPAHSP